MQFGAIGSTLTTVVNVDYSSLVTLTVATVAMVAN